MELVGGEKPHIIGHRGGAGLRPENTMAAINHALALGVDGIEVDVHLSADGQVVVHHDYALNPALTRKGGAWLDKTGSLLKDLTYKQMLDYDVGACDPASAYAQKFPDLVAYDGACIPLLRDVVERMGKADAAHCQLLVEIKSEADDLALSGDPLTLTDKVIACLRAAGMTERSVLIAFNWAVLLHGQKNAPDLRTGYLTLPAYAFGRAPVPVGAKAPTAEDMARLCSYDNRPAPWAAGFDPYLYDGSIFKAIAAAGGTYWGPFYGDVDVGAAEAARAQGLGISVWAPNAHEDLRAMIEAQVDFIATDRPDDLLEMLGRSAAHLR